MLFFIAVGLLSLVTGILFLLFPDYLRRMNEKAVSIVTSFDTVLFTYRIGLGFFLVVASFLFFFVAYYIRVKG